MAILLIPMAALMASTTPSEPIAPGNRKAYCRGEVSAQYETRPMYVTTGKLVKGAKGTTSVSGTVDKGSEGIKKFKCRFDTKGRLIDVMALTPDGE
ncbi:hypothetical protein LZ496_05105 [Sphingomonas sp. NSE70-1]|uniref:DUF5666 domain-containing protein n=1 Tax=Sphingomonas caseinilyticus TaxID=2908205 RepID=A0ABT0RTW5_9SPHN|nr:hypothetical protein [Sphingomonas caseinilyticus]MCL6698160.1 hypothetical protein [Sphingomonas caseinilyticus]